MTRYRNLVSLRHPIPSRRRGAGAAPGVATADVAGGANNRKGLRPLLLPSLRLLRRLARKTPNLSRHSNSPLRPESRNPSKARLFLKRRLNLSRLLRASLGRRNAIIVLLPKPAFNAASSR